MPTHAPKLVIIGRDGILNAFREGHVISPEEWVALPGALEALAKLTHAGWHVVVATNQPGVGRGLLDMASLNAVHRHMTQQAMLHGARIDAVFFCPHMPEDQCNCRKPLPGLLKEITQRYGAIPQHVAVVGDTLRDLEAARAAGCQPHLIRSGRAALVTEAEVAQWLAAVPSAELHGSLAEFAERWVARPAPLPPEKVAA